MKILTYLLNFNIAAKYNVGPIYLMVLNSVYPLWLKNENQLAAHKIFLESPKKKNSSNHVTLTL